MLKCNARYTQDTQCTAGFSSHWIIKENTHEESLNMVATLGACNTEAGTDTWGFMEHCPNWHCHCVSIIVSASLWDMKCNTSGCEYWLRTVSMDNSHEDTITGCETTGVE